MIPFSLNTLPLKRNSRRRVKREVLDVPVTLADSESLISSLKVSGVKSWAKMAPGSIKIVKRIGPPMPA